MKANVRTGIVAALLAAISIALVLLVAGCSGRDGEPTPKSEQTPAKLGLVAKVCAERDKLSEEVHKLVETQEYCVVSRERLGSMGPPVKLIVQGQTVFLCCDGCREKALADPARTLAGLEEVKRRARREKGPSDDVPTRQP